MLLLFCCGLVLIGCIDIVWNCSGLCAVSYFVFGCMCLDRFTSKAFLSTHDPLVSTAIPTTTPTADARHPHRTTGEEPPSSRSTTDVAAGSYMSPPQH